MGHENEIVFQRVTSDYIRSVCGLLTSDTPVTKELLEERARDKKHEEAKHKWLLPKKKKGKGAWKLR